MFKREACELRRPKMTNMTMRFNELSDDSFPKTAPRSSRPSSGILVEPQHKVFCGVRLLHGEITLYVHHLPQHTQGPGFDIRIDVDEF